MAKNAYQYYTTENNIDMQQKNGGIQKKSEKI